MQFARWDYGVPRYLETARHVVEMQKAGKIRHIGATNFDHNPVQELLDAGIPIVANQAQCSLLDHRVADDLHEIDEEYGIP